MAAATTRSSGRFVGELNRALAQRGRLDGVYQALSDHWTRLLQRMWPVWAIVGPGLASPAHIELATRTVYLDSDELLGERRELIDGTIAPIKVLAALGAGIHEVLHAKHTKLWVSDRDIQLAASENTEDRQLAVDRQLLEEPRMEATGVREFPPGSRRGRFVGRAIAAACAQIILPRFVELCALQELAQGVASRELAARSQVYLAGRCHYGVLDRSRLDPMPGLWRRALGDADVARLEDLLGRLIWCPDGENDPLDRYAREYREIVGAPPPTGSPAGAAGEARANRASRQPGSGESGGEADRGAEGESGDREASGPQAGSLIEALRQAIGSQRDGQLEQLDEDLDLKALAEHAARPAPPGGGSRGTGLPTGRMPRRGVDRPPAADEAQMARQYARRLHQAREIGQRTIDKRTPGGRFNSRQHMRASAQRKTGAPVTARPWQTTKTITAPLQEPHVALVIDTSGSMGAHEYALGPIAWVLSEGLREFGGRVAIALFGNAAELLADGSRPLRLVPGIKTGGGTAFGADALSLCAEHLELENPRRPRLAYCLSDGGWADTETGVAKVRELRKRGVPVVHISIGIAPLSVEADRVVVIADPADAMDLVAADTVQALRARRRH
jgi:Mg-chelatase subunit ChlD